MVQRRIRVAAAAVALLAVGCSSGSSRTTASSTTKAAPPTTAGVGGTTFVEAVTALRAQVRAAGTDLCKLRTVLESIGRTGDPQTRADTVVAIGFVDELYNAVARALDGQSDAKVQATAATWRAAASAVRTAGAKADYQPSALDDSAELGLPDDFSDATQAFGTLTASCTTADK